MADNYLSKVAHLNKIGDVICFQGATAKNEALVAVFEHKLQKPIFVSKYCHLTGALGVCLLLQEKQISVSHFRGLDFYKQTPQVSRRRFVTSATITASLPEFMLKMTACSGDSCAGAMKPTAAPGRLINRASTCWAAGATFSIRPIIRRKRWSIQQMNAGETPARGIPTLNLDCSLDKLKEQLGLNVLNLRHRFFAFTQEEYQGGKERLQITIGIPNTLYLWEYVPFWELFFRKLGYQVAISTPQASFIEKGKEMAGADFCAPIAYWHGQLLILKSSGGLRVPAANIPGDGNQQA